MDTRAEPAWREALAALPSGDASASELLELVSMLGHMQAAIDAVKVRAAGKLVRRWNALDDEPDGGALRDGHRNPEAMLSERWRITYAAAKQLCDVADAVVARIGSAGDTLPAFLPELAASLDPENPSVGHVSIDQAGVIVRELEKAAVACTPENLLHGERLLVKHAPNLTVAEVRTLAGQVRDRLDEHGILPREKLQTLRRSLKITTTTAGMTHIDWFLQPEAAGHVVTAIDALVGTELKTVRFRDPDQIENTAGTGDDEHRSLDQLRSDAATEIFRDYAMNADTTRAGGRSRPKPPVTMIVRIGIDSLCTGTGYGEIDGVPTPISASTARRLAADANIIPAVLAGDSEILDLGRSQRLFSTKQKLALAERDGGCAWAGCSHPPAYTEAHHIRWWDRHNGPTDLDNGILLCSHHHHRIHNNGWQIEVREHVPWFIPPAHVDHLRRPRRGGRIRLPTATETG